MAKAASVRLFITGDTHGNTRWVTNYLYPTAAALRADFIVQLGDFGYWEHAAEGVRFLDDVNEAADEHGISLLFLRGNHDKASLLHEKYGSAGMVEVRPNVVYLPDGHFWNWAGRTFRVFGGAYSVDKDLRLRAERRRREQVVRSNTYRRANKLPEQPVPDTAGTLWFPEEEMSDEDMTRLLEQYAEPVDVILSHDMPFSSDPGGPFKKLPPCIPNQRRLDQALRLHHPLFWFHGHLHHPYTNEVWHRTGLPTEVVGLSCDDQASGRFWRPYQTWGLLDLATGEPMTYTSGGVAHEWVTGD